MKLASETRGKRASTKADVGCAALFGLPFAGFGIMMGWAAFQAFQNQGLGHHQPWIMLVFHVVFTGVGLGLPVLAWNGAKSEKARLAELEQNAKHLWLTRDDWATGRIDHDASKGAKGMFLIALFWNGISYPAAYGAITQEVIGKGKNEALMVLLFPLVGLGFIWAAIHAFLKARRFGKSRFVMEQIPGTIGTVMRGIVVTGVTRAAAASAPFTVRLTCFRRSVTGSGKNRQVNMANLWMDERQFKGIPRRDQPDHLAVPVAFPIPTDCLETTLEDPNRRILWRLDVTAEIPGVDYSSDFEIPVFRTPESPAAGAEIVDHGPTNEAFNATQEALPEADAPLSRGIRVTPLAGGGVECNFAPMRNLGAVVSLTVFNLLWGGSIWFMTHLGAPIFFPIVFGLFQIILIIALFTMATAAGTITATRNSIRIKRGPFGFGALKIVNAPDVAELSLSTGMQSGNTYYWDVKLKTKAATTHKLVTAIKDKAEANRLATAIATAAGLPPSIITVGHSARAKHLTKS